MAKGKYHVVKREDGMWQVKKEGAEKALKLFKTQKEAISYADKVADNQDTAIAIHKVDGKMRKQDYSKKPEEKKKAETKKPDDKKTTKK